MDGFLEDLLNNMMRHKDGWPFDRPITRSDAPDYYRIITRPIDLGTIHTNLLRMKYSTNQKVLQDIQLVFKNCYTYNRQDAEVFHCAVRLEKYLSKEAKKLGLVYKSVTTVTDNIKDEVDHATDLESGKKRKRINESTDYESDVNDTEDDDSEDNGTDDNESDNDPEDDDSDDNDTEEDDSDDHLEENGDCDAKPKCLKPVEEVVSVLS